MMASLDGFYQRGSTVSEGKSTVVSVRLNPQHEVYAGHFPGKPIAPGAALTQMVLDELSELTGRKPVLQLRQIKFLSVIDPTEVQDLQLVYGFVEKDGTQMFTCLGTSSDTRYFKLNGILG